MPGTCKPTIPRAFRRISFRGSPLFLGLHVHLGTDGPNPAPAKMDETPMKNGGFRPPTVFPAIVDSMDCCFKEFLWPMVTVPLTGIAVVLLDTYHVDDYPCGQVKELVY